MSYISGEENGILCQKDTRGDNLHKRREQRNVEKENFFVTKTLYDPENMLSKRCKKKLLSEILSSFSPNVPYSVNKSKRWQKFTTKSILTDAQENLQRIEAVVVHRTEVPLKANRRRVVLEKYVWDCAGDAIETGKLEKNGKSQSPLHLAWKERKSEPEHRLSQQCPNLPLTSQVLKKSFDTEDFFKRPSLLDVTTAIEAPHILEVIEIKIKKLDIIDLRKQFLPSVPPAFVVRWFGSNRVSISSPSYAKPSFVIFFEHEENNTTFRVRINTNSQYCQEANKENLLTIVQDRIYRDHETLFDDLYKFILRTKKMDCEINDDGRRFAICPESFDYNVNSTVIAPNATLFMEQEQLDHLSQLYTHQNPEISSFEFIHQAGDPKVCCMCRVVNDDLFSSIDGLICRDCTISSITRQLQYHP
ncbi:unnamed protein product [Cylicocyclus nassatus]|uniref:Uncharacterized protein n=1 Tax=Cylicocyclus nassatus TaxID=53992 RepID=A0AA36M8Q3_CYLNA|nr:unnamed protein product [Cylicocyclus nassatus]